MGKVHMTLVTVLKLVISTSMSIKQASKTTSFLMLVTAFGHKKISAQKFKKQFFFQDKFYSLRAHAYYFIYT